jgi:hypothetical protein
MKRKRRKIKKETLPTKRVRTKKQAKKIRVEFYRAKKTLRSKLGTILFRKNKEYRFFRKLHTSTKELQGFIVASEFQPNGHVIYDNSWGEFFEKSNRVVYENPKKPKDTLSTIQEIERTRHSAASVSNDKPKRVRKHKPTIKTEKKRRRVKPIKIKQKTEKRKRTK